jgi:uncharacterized protein with PhoU and TrkA domain
MAGTTNTIVKKVTVGTPIKNVTSGAITISSLSGVNVSGVREGSLLIYDSASATFIVDSDMSSVYVEVNGGTF